LKHPLPELPRGKSFLAHKTPEALLHKRPGNAEFFRTWHLIGSIRRDCLDHVIVFGETHLHRILKSCASYYNHIRTHLALDNNAPEFRQAQRVGAIMALPALGELHHHYVRD
jgi:hypothetical protein